MEKWEYLTYKVKKVGWSGLTIQQDQYHFEVNQLGEQGWELVSCFPTAISGTTLEVVSVFKRRKST
ncbi:DUF4177 domain-containing protein [Paenibacillus sp. WQ 127069]|uniref:DUF4177 domain-containing protein n=1 Tax=Paenibacillus baimaensis TaxID=2982185 RepID=A0ABT2UEL9_9BACL|nr:DUF4177 domain-containing protein [Paenibacillus sp. WQ 127069]MCU6793081.1 DUF4177 domain-containing protein [Paenibacillus sp. WQ 127069]